MSQDEYKEKVRDIVRQHLLALKDDLDMKLEQTTHGVLVANLGRHLEEAYTLPSAHSVSNLSQSIALFLKESISASRR